MTDGVVNMEAVDADSAAQLEVPGTCYVKLLHQIPAEVFNGRQLYLLCRSAIKPTSSRVQCVENVY